MKYRRSIKVIVAIIVLYFVTMAVKNNYEMYQSDIGTVIYVAEKETGYDKEPQYSQEITLDIQNGKYKGQLVEAVNTYSYSQYSTTAYHIGDDVFLSLKEAESGLKVTINKLKLDYYVAFILSVFIVVAVLVAGRIGVLSLATLAVNVGIFVLTLKFFMAEKYLVFITILMTIFFVVSVMLILNGFHKKSWGAIVSSLLTEGIIFLIYGMVYRYGEQPAWEFMEYTLGNEDFEILFLSSVIIGSLGAVMDVAITIHGSAAEIMDTAKELSRPALVKSLREIGYDIMGTMVNVLFFSYLSGSLPMFLLKSINGYSFSNIFHYDIVFEMLRFLVGSIGIVLAIPISASMAVWMYRKQLAKEGNV